MTRWRCGLGLVLLAARGAAQTSPPPPAQDLAPIAKLVERGRLDEAERQLREILARRGDASARDLLGVVLLKRGRLDEAEREMTLAIASRPDLGPVHQHLARVYLARGRRDEAAGELRRAAERGPLDRDLALELASVELARGRPELAEAQLRSAADRFDSVEALFQLARLQAREKHTAPALESLRRARAIAPNSEEVLKSYAELALTAGVPVRAVLALEPLARMCPEVAEYRYILGVALLQLGDAPASVEALREAERLEPDRPLTLLALGLALNTRKLYAEAKPYLLKSLELQPDNLDSLAALAEAEGGLGELALAEEHAQAALARAAGNPTANLVIGMLRMQQERYLEARAALGRAVEAEPTLPKAHYQLSLACARLNDEPSAKRHLELYQDLLKREQERLAQLGRETDIKTPRAER